jgi:Mg2+ and Co2+ transporter CorA
MNFEYLPLIHSDQGMWFMLAIMVLTMAIVVLVFWRKRYLARTGR